MKNYGKHSYHPLVQFFYFSGMLSDTQIANIPKSTIDYWKSIDHQNMFGYEWVQEFYINHHEFDRITKRKIVFKVARICSPIAHYQLYKQKYILHNRGR